MKQRSIVLTKKEQLILDIQNLLNSYDEVNSTSINPDLLEFMDEKTLISIIDTLLKEKESLKETDIEWLEKFKKYK
ncbi:hypothetical protein FJR48_05955 [Sulfurimonas lithotrophica]|uniref:Uncharacterized protein n=1 Tax=Sulfurimonas lithotrophica TaxID=2590022 RepID=A0A5P8P0R1_9BACT|nr:hypothetical protein FJR48_05955 [Sulfurimonas lithotrophica]